MSRTTNEKGFDCLAFKRQAQAEIYEAIRDLPVPQQIEYLRRRAESGALGDWWKSVKNAHRGSLRASPAPGADPPGGG